MWKALCVCGSPLHGWTACLANVMQRSALPDNINGYLLLLGHLLHTVHTTPGCLLRMISVPMCTCKLCGITDENYRKIRRS